MLPPLPRCGGWASSSLVSPSRVSLPRYDGQVGPHIFLFEVCSAFTCVAACTLALPPIRDTLSEGFSHFVTSMTAPVASGGSEFAGWGLHPLESAAFARRTPKAAILEFEQMWAAEPPEPDPSLLGANFAEVGKADRSMGHMQSPSPRPCGTSVFTRARPRTELAALAENKRMPCHAIYSTDKSELS